MTRVAEVELYPPVKAYLERIGYHVSAEVAHCDVAAVKDDKLVIVELKSAANLTLLIQATERQSITDAVYVALPEPARRNGHFRGVERLLKRLGLGLITVRFSPLGASADKRFDPAPHPAKGRAARRRAVLDELAGRKDEGNIGGSTRVPIMTAYRETAIFIACCLERLGPLSTRRLRALGAGEKTTAILSRDYYGWFERVARGVYRVTPRGIEAISHYPQQKQRTLSLIGDELGT